jgi:hypothetical protein
VTALEVLTKPTPQVPDPCEYEQRRPAKILLFPQETSPLRQGIPKREKDHSAEFHRYAPKPAGIHPEIMEKIPNNSERITITWLRTPIKIRPDYGP